VRFDNSFDQIQTKPVRESGLATTLAAKEGIKDVLPFFRGNAWPRSATRISTAGGRIFVGAAEMPIHCRRARHISWRSQKDFVARVAWTLCRPGLTANQAQTVFQRLDLLAASHSLRQAGQLLSIEERIAVRVFPVRGRRGVSVAHTCSTSADSFSACSRIRRVTSDLPGLASEIASQIVSCGANNSERGSQFVGNAGNKVHLQLGEILRTAESAQVRRWWQN